MNKFRRFLGRISSETCLKWIILKVNLQKLAELPDSLPPRLGASLPDPVQFK